MYNIRPSRPPKPKKVEELNELPADLQEVYNSLHLTKKQFEVLDDFLEKALKAIENENKYEKALLKMSGYVQNCNKCIHEENSSNCARSLGYDDDAICRQGHSDYYKRQAGLEV